MSSIDKDIELLNFIDKKILDKENIDLKKIFLLFIRIMKNTIINCYTKLDNINYTMSCMDMIFPIFWIIYSYTYNSKLTMFLSERAVVLFNEYINLSSTMESNTVNLADVKLFIYKKTLGPLILKNDNKNNLEISKLFTLSSFFKNFLKNIFCKIYSDKSELNTKLDIVTSILENNVFECHNYTNLDFVCNLLEIDDITIDNFKYNILLIKIKLDIYKIIFNDNDNSNDNDNENSNFKKKEYKNNNLNINIPYSIIDNDENMIETQFYKNLINQIQNDLL